ncbi:AAA family ATPase [Pedobacter gandavensis]|uniref:AAA family ATPase n=1 Tax=Pedobacter gandavensis TaxID=2679963 RepID=UPI0029319BDD|nr:AAA family ATPase [Pedobacter gandavensis]
MKRIEFEDLLRWRLKKNRKPIIIRGARQVGKTWLMKAFGKKEYEQTAYVNFESNKLLKGVFEQDFDIKRIIM